MIALVDCNSFFCSVEKAFHAGLNGKPVCVLSSNDGCIIALTPEAKAIGLHRGDPIYKVRDLVKYNNVAIFSTNMYLYAAMSSRVTNILRSFVNHVENYSIDESFCFLDGYDKLYDLEDYMRMVVKKVKLYTDIPVSVGIAQSRTLAKMGSKFAKNYKGYNSVCIIDTDEKRRKALSMMELSDVWGIGRRILPKLEYYGVHTPLELADKKEAWIKSRFSLPMVQTWKELNGISCIDTSEIAGKQSICTSRSFGEKVTDISSLRAAVANFAASSANKLRGQHSVASVVTVFIMTSRFCEDLRPYSNSLTVTLPVPTSDTIEITKAALQIVEDIYVKGICYKKAGVVLSDITNNTAIQQNLFDDIQNRPQRFKLMNTIDKLNHRYGLKSIKLAVEGADKEAWHSKSEHRSGNYISDLNEIMMIQI
jgi:Nucleotidyltransferase/DNA polymerase involved in DNA repair